ncbi:hypothetical protein Bca52824_023329 [Brassica carinata]|uniref:At2g35280-like TPR domain-containing protein n=1 Tax=Brassica carinata TaxID=52824 RepID=A0A8X8AVJ0_BRACI|nr:hypothetical protein Bca52824_023329 [Brassica carinata]
MGSDTYVNNGYIINIDDDSDYDDYSNPDPTSYYRNISLRYFAAEPQEMLTEHTKLKELCLENGNPEAHYIEGILQYLVKEDKRAGLRHLRLSSIRKNSNGTYLYGLLMLVHGHYHKGKKFYGEEDKVNKNHVPKVTTREKRKKWGQTPFKTIQDMKRTDKDGKHPIPIGVDYRKCSKTQHKQKPVAAKTLDVPLSIVFPRLLNDLTNRNFASRFQSQITASNPTSKRGA